MYHYLLPGIHTVSVYTVELYHSRIVNTGLRMADCRPVEVDRGAGTPASLGPTPEGAYGRGARGWQEREGASHSVGVAGGGGAAGEPVGNLAGWRGGGCGAKEAEKERAR